MKFFVEKRPLWMDALVKKIRERKGEKSGSHSNLSTGYIYMYIYMYMYMYMYRMRALLTGTSVLVIRERHAFTQTEL